MVGADWTCCNRLPRTKVHRHDQTARPIARTCEKGRRSFQVHPFSVRKLQAKVWKGCRTDSPKDENGLHMVSKDDIDTIPKERDGSVKMTD